MAPACSCVRRAARDAGTSRPARRAHALFRRGEDPSTFYRPSIESLCRGKLQTVSEQGFALLDGTLSVARCAHLRAEMECFFEKLPRGEDSDTHRAGIRSDFMTGTNEHEMERLGYRGLSQSILILKGVGREVARALDPSARLAPNVQIAAFKAGGTHYKRHADNLVSKHGWKNWREHSPRATRVEPAAAARPRTPSSRSPHPTTPHPTQRTPVRARADRAARLPRACRRVHRHPLRERGLGARAWRLPTHVRG